MPSYIDLEGFIARTLLSEDAVREVEAAYPGFVARRLLLNSARVDIRLRKRYAAPFSGPPYSEVVIGWVVDLTAPEVLTKRGRDPNDTVSEDLANNAARANEELKEAADSEQGLFDLPMRDESKQSGVVGSVPFGYSEPDPYTWTDRQREAIDYEQ